MRYTLTANAPETKDNDFTWKDFQARNNNELVAIFGNFINRVSVLTHKYFEGVVPSPGPLSQTDRETLKTARAFPATLEDSIIRYRFREVSQELMNLARLGNQYLAGEEPWKVIKEDEERVQTILFVALQIAASLGVLSAPFLPFTSEKLVKMLGLDQADGQIPWKEVSREEPLLPAGHRIGKSELLFRKIEDQEIEAQLARLEATKKSNESENTTVMPQKETINFDDFSKMDLRVGTIVAAEKMPKTKKLMVLQVDTGMDTRTIVSGIAESFEPEAILGKKVTVLANLAPRPLRGVESQGMILMTENREGKLVFPEPR